MPKKAGDFADVEVRISNSNPSLEFPVFRCRWRGPCDVQLHNLPTLRRHLQKVHRASLEEVSAQGGHVCWWRKCPLLEKDDQDQLYPSKTFDGYDEWFDHIHVEHVCPLGMKLGDGPSTNCTGKQKPESSETTVSKYFYHSIIKPIARTDSYTDPQNLTQDRANYLCDERGRTTTLVVPEFSKDDAEDCDSYVLTDQFSTDYEDRKQAQEILKGFFRTHGNEKMEARQAAHETIKALTTRKQQVGVGIDRGGCTLINDARRTTFVQNPQISRVVENDE